MWEILRKIVRTKTGYICTTYLQISEFLIQLQCQIFKWITVGFRFYDRNCAQLNFLPLLYVSSAVHYELSHGALNSAKKLSFGRSHYSINFKKQNKKNSGSCNLQNNIYFENIYLLFFVYFWLWFYSLLWIIFSIFEWKSFS